MKASAFTEVLPGSSRRMVDGYLARVVDNQGQDVPDGEAGRLWVRGDSTAKYYWNNPAKTASTMLSDGWLDTGDTYYRDGEGFFYYCSRNDDMLKGRRHLVLALRDRGQDH